MLLHSDRPSTTRSRRPSATRSRRPSATRARRSTTSYSVVLVALAVLIALPVTLLMLGDPRPTTGVDPVLFPQPPASATSTGDAIPDGADVLDSRMLADLRGARPDTAGEQTAPVDILDSWTLRELRDARPQPPADGRDAEGRSLVELGRSTMDGPTTDAAALQGAASAAPVVWWWGEESGTTSLIRTADSLSATWESDVADLGGKAMTLWIVVFNNPDACTTGPGFPRCTEGDIFTADGAVNQDVGPDFLYADGIETIDGGQIELAGIVTTADPAGTTGTGLGELICAIRGLDGAPCDPASVTTPGLQDPAGAEVHLILHNHGKAMAGDDLTHQTSTFLGGCQSVPAPFPTGPDDLAECQSIQIAIHQPETDPAPDGVVVPAAVRELLR